MTEAMLRPPQGMECTNTSPKTIEDYMRKSAQFDYGRIGSCCSISSPGGAHTMPQYRGGVEAPPGDEMYQHKSKNH
jgi:hypothetical protein